jgi:hypothetical protein
VTRVGGDGGTLYRVRLGDRGGRESSGTVRRRATDRQAVGEIEGGRVVGRAHDVEEAWSHRDRGRSTEPSGRRRPIHAQNVRKNASPWTCTSCCPINNKNKTT